VEVGGILTGFYQLVRMCMRIACCVIGIVIAEDLHFVEMDIVRINFAYIGHLFG